MKNIVIAGNVTRDWESASVGDSTVYRSAIAVASKKKIDGTWEKHTDFFNVSAWGKRGETLAKYAGKGSFLSVSGELIVGTFMKKNGEPGVDLQVKMSDFTFGPSRKSDDGGSGQFGSQPDTAPSGSFGEGQPF